MNLSLLGLRWYKRSLTLKGFNSFLHEILKVIRTAHPVFSDLHWVGDGKHAATRLTETMDNLDSLVYRYSWGSKKDIQGDRNADGTPTWLSEGIIGFSMMFNTGKSSKVGGMTVSVHAGDGGDITPNCVTMTFPPPGSRDSPFHECYEDNLLLALFIKLIEVSGAETGLVTTDNFSKAVYSDGPYDIGWLTYIADERCAPLRSRFLTEEADVPGTIFSLGREFMFLDTDQTVSAGRDLRSALKQLNLLR